ncbi:MAG: helix-turn-helix domain-containing protein [Phycisphaerales bacterium]
MAKLFYTLQEAAERLNKTPDQVMDMARNGQLQELQDKGETLFRRSAIDALATDEGSGSFSLESLDVGNEGSSLSLGGSGGLDDLGDLRLEDSSSGAPAAKAGGDDLKLEDDALSLGDDLRLDDDLKIDDGLRLDDDLKLDDAPAAPIAASGADDSVGFDDLTLAADAAPAPAAAARSAPAAPVAPAAGIGLADSSAESIMMEDAPARSSAGTAAGTSAGTKSGDSMSFNSGATLETVGGGSGLLDISSEESFFGAQMIEESMGGDEAAVNPDEAGELFGGDVGSAEPAEPVTVGTAPAIAFGAQQLAEARDPKFSGFSAGALVAAVLALVAMGWAVAEMALGNYTDMGRMLAENWMYVLGGSAGAVLLFGGIGLGVGKAVG